MFVFFVYDDPDYIRNMDPDPGSGTVFDFLMDADSETQSDLKLYADKHEYGFGTLPI